MAIKNQLLSAQCWRYIFRIKFRRALDTCNVAWILNLVKPLPKPDLKRSISGSRNQDKKQVFDDPETASGLEYFGIGRPVGYSYSGAINRGAPVTGRGFLKRDK